MELPGKTNQILSVVNSVLARLELPAIHENEFFTLTPSEEPEGTVLSFYREGYIPFELIIGEESFYFIVDGVILPAYYETEKVFTQLHDLEDDILSLFIYKAIVTRSKSENKVDFYTEDETYLGAFIQSFPSKDESPEERVTTYAPICVLSVEEREDLLYQKEKEMASSYYKEDEVKKIKEKRKVSLPGNRIVLFRLGYSALGVAIVLLLSYAFNPQYTVLFVSMTILFLVADYFLSNRKMYLKEYPELYREESFEKGLRATRDQLGGTVLTYGPEYVMLFFPKGYLANKTGVILYILKDAGRLYMTQVTINDSTLRKWQRKEDIIQLFLENMKS